MKTHSSTTTVTLMLFRAATSLTQQVKRDDDQSANFGHYKISPRGRLQTQE